MGFMGILLQYTQYRILSPNPKPYDIPKAIFYLLKGDYNPNIYPIIIYTSLHFLFHYPYTTPLKALYSIYLRGTMSPPGDNEKVYLKSALS